MNYIYTDKPIEQAANYIADTLTKHLLLGERVLWLLSGGSSIPIAVEASIRLLDHDLSNLYVSLTDERYGPIGHKDENWQQLLSDGLSLPGATLYRPLINQDIKTTTIEFNNWLEVQLDKADFKLGIFGLGADGHTAGIKPHSQAVATTELSASLVGEDFERVTISFNTIKMLDEAVIQASGADKRDIVHDLLYGNFPLDDQPAQILKTIPNTTIYTNNQKEQQ